MKRDESTWVSWCVSCRSIVAEQPDRAEVERLFALHLKETHPTETRALVEVV